MRCSVTFGNPSASESDHEPDEQPVEETWQQEVFPELGDLEPLF